MGEEGYKMAFESCFLGLKRKKKKGKKKREEVAFWNDFEVISGASGNFPNFFTAFSSDGFCEISST